MTATGNVAAGIVRTGSIVSERLAVDDCDALSVALTVKLDVPAAVGVPCSNPPGLSVRPPGKVPLVTVQENGAIPPVAWSCWLYAAF